VKPGEEHSFDDQVTMGWPAVHIAWHSLSLLWHGAGSSRARLRPGRSERRSGVNRDWIRIASFTRDLEIAKVVTSNRLFDMADFISVPICGEATHSASLLFHQRCFGVSAAYSTTSEIIK